ncbi:hypothetical protein ACJX0J_016598 [Zea mays]
MAKRNQFMFDRLMKLTHREMEPLGFREKENWRVASQEMVVMIHMKKLYHKGLKKEGYKIRATIVEARNTSLPYHALIINGIHQKIAQLASVKDELDKTEDTIKRLFLVKEQGEHAILQKRFEELNEAYKGKEARKGKCELNDAIHKHARQTWTHASHEKMNLITSLLRSTDEDEDDDEEEEIHLILVKFHIIILVFANIDYFSNIIETLMGSIL